MSCSALQSVGYHKLLEAHRFGEEKTTYTFSLKLMCEDKPGMLMQLFAVFSELRINITGIHSEMYTQGQQYVYVNAELTNPSKMAFLINALKKQFTSLKIVKKQLQ